MAIEGFAQHTTKVNVTFYRASANEYLSNGLRINAATTHVSRASDLQSLPNPGAMFLATRFAPTTWIGRRSWIGVSSEISDGGKRRCVVDAPHAWCTKPPWGEASPCAPAMPHVLEVVRNQ